MNERLKAKVKSDDKSRFAMNSGDIKVIKKGNGDKKK